VLLHEVYLEGIRVKFVYEGHRVKVKVTLAEKAQNPPFPQCKTSIDNDSGSIKHGPMKFSCSMGCSTMADRMVWPPSLSRDRKWPAITHCTHSQVVGLRLEGDLFFCNFDVGLLCINFNSRRIDPYLRDMDSPSERLPHGESICLTHECRVEIPK